LISLQLALVALVGALLSLVQGYVLNIAGAALVTSVRQKLFKAMTLKPMAFFDSTHTGELTSRLSSDTTLLRTGLTDGLAGALPALATAVGGFFYLFTISWKLTLVMLVAIPMIFGIIKLFSGKITAAANKVQEAIAVSTAEAEEAMSNIRTVRQFSAEVTHQELYHAVSVEAYGHMKHAAVLQSGFGLIMRVVVVSAILFIIWFGASLVISGEMTVGVLTSYILLVFTMAGSFGQLVFLATMLLRTAGATERIFEIINGPAEPNIAEGTELSSIKGEVRLEDVCFAYPSRPTVPVLQGLTLTLEPNQITALVGPSGGGKSTIASLITRLYAPSSGSIHLDGHALGNLDLRCIHRYVVAVNQEPVLFSGSIRDNILYGVDEQFRTEENMQAAAEIANVQEFIKRFPQGFDTLVGERGIQLSGGQKQRVAIARAIVRQPQILLLDEATSALDSENEALVQEALNRCMKGRTSLVIAHRLSTVKDANVVYVIDSGRVSAKGTHTELMQTSDLYKNLVNKQLLTSSGVDAEFRHTIQAPQH